MGRRNSSKSARSSDWLEETQQKKRIALRRKFPTERNRNRLSEEKIRQAENTIDLEDRRYLQQKTKKEKMVTDG